jgi:4-carboxymuconolactone decarboxylase
MMRAADTGWSVGKTGKGTKAYQDGLAVRRAVLGAEYVDRAIASADSFTGELQQFVTEWCWGGVWTRPGLPRKTRSLLNLAMLAAMNRPHEVRIHVRGALKNGVTREEIAEVFLQVGVYAGAPAAVDAFRSAKEVFDEIDQQKINQKKTKPVRK